MMMDWPDRLALCLDDPEQVEALRPLLEEYAIKTRRTLHLVDRLLGVGAQQSDLAREHERLIIDHHEALVRVEELEHSVATANAWISTLQDRIAEFEDAEAEDLFAKVGLRETAHDVVVAAARRALLTHFHPDRFSAEDKDRMSAQFASASAAFDKIAELRR